MVGRSRSASRNTVWSEVSWTCSICGGLRRDVLWQQPFHWTGITSFTMAEPQSVTAPNVVGEFIHDEVPNVGAGRSLLAGRRGF